MRDTLVSNSGIAKGMPGRTQALTKACFALPPRSQEDRDSLIEQSNILLKQSPLHCDIIIGTIE